MIANGYLMWMTFVLLNHEIVFSFTAVHLVVLAALLVNYLSTTAEEVDGDVGAIKKRKVHCRMTHMINE